MENTTAICTGCDGPIRNRAAEGRPDLWSHTDPGRPCHYANPPADVVEAQPVETRKVRMRVEETVIYEMEITIPVHKGVTSDELPIYLGDHQERWIDYLGDTYYSSGDRLVVYDETWYTDDAGYLERLATAIEIRPERIKKWMTATCPVCGVQPGPGDASHQMVGDIIGIACNGKRLVDPNWVGMEDDSWVDWVTEDDTGSASEHDGKDESIRPVVKIEPVRHEGETRYQAVCHTPGCTLGADGAAWVSVSWGLRDDTEWLARLHEEDHRNPDREPISTAAVKKTIVEDAHEAR